MRGPTYIFWANLTLFSLQRAAEAEGVRLGGNIIAPDAGAWIYTHSGLAAALQQPYSGFAATVQ
jgi:hypothetical protein